ncbi:hypothetical protein [Bradyrhizobium genomosp. I (2014)]|uniref:hypothetical protein n=1 Tax=Bradyrhizobium genomosp. I (2014) TaxID=2683269 RepID=UPI0004B4955F|nr:hypothetical protein [Bradyrhizobium sp. CCBAU 43298]
MTIEDEDAQAASPSRQRKIIHIEMDAFYASVDRWAELAHHARPQDLGPALNHATTSAGRLRDEPPCPP